MGAEQAKMAMQSIEMPGTATAEEKNPDGTVKKAACTAIRRSLESRDGLMTNSYSDVTTVYENFMRGVRLAGDGNCLGVRVKNEDGSAGNYVFQSYNTVAQRVHNFGAGLVSLGVQAGAHMGIYSINRPEWTIAELGGYSQSIINIALYDTLGPEAVEYIINQATITTVVCSADKVMKVISSVQKAPSVKMIIQMDGNVADDAKSAAAAAGLEIKTFAEVEEAGKASPREPVKPQPSTLATIMYTSGTTGLPKGVMLTHGNVVAAVSAAASPSIAINFTKEDSYISYLPLAHIFERVVQGAMFCNGGSAGYFQGDVAKLVEDIGVLKPTVFPSVPRLFSRIFDKVMQGVAQKGAVAQYLFNWVYSSKKEQVSATGRQPTHMLDNVVFAAVKERLGGRVRVMITGSAPISAEVFNFLQVCFCCPVLNGYGLTETSAAVSIMRCADYEYSAGPPVPCAEVKLMEVPEMNYFVKDNKGEVMVRGPGVFQGYYKDEAKTKEALDEEGWFATGDIGAWNPNGTLKIIDRRKNIFKLSQGEYVAAEYLEGIFVRSPFVAQSFVYGDSLQHCLVGVVVPDFDVMGPWCKENGVAGEGPADWVKSAEVSKKLNAELQAIGKEAKLRGFEFLRAIHVEHEAFSAENGLLTPTFKSQRPKLKAKYQDQINEMYAKINADASK